MQNEVHLKTVWYGLYERALKLVKLKKHKHISAQKHLQATDVASFNIISDTI